MHAKMVLNIAEFFNFFAAEQALEYIFEATRLIINAQSLRVMARKLF